jgi:hypothetical protein
MAFNPAALKGLFSKLKPIAKSSYDDVAKAIVGNADDVARATDNLVSLDSLDDLAGRVGTLPPATEVRVPITIGGPAQPIADSFNGMYGLNRDFDDVPYVMPTSVQSKPAQSVQDILNSDELKNTIKSAAENTQNTFTFDQLENGSWKDIAKERSLRDFYDSAVSKGVPKRATPGLDMYDPSVDFPKQLKYDSIVEHGANRKKLDSLLKTKRFNSHRYFDYPELFQDDLPF